MKNKKNASRNNLFVNHDSDSDEEKNGHTLSPTGMKEKSKNGWTNLH
jgi:hypothetical protein